MHEKADHDGIDEIQASPGSSEPPSSSPENSPDPPPPKPGDGPLEDITGSGPGDSPGPKEESKWVRLDRVVRECDREADHIQAEFSEVWQWMRDTASRFPDWWRQWPQAGGRSSSSSFDFRSFGEPGKDSPHPGEASSREGSSSDNRESNRRDSNGRSSDGNWRRFVDENSDRTSGPSSSRWADLNAKYPNLSQLISGWPKSTFRAKIGIASLVVQTLTQQFEEWGQGPFRGVRKQKDEEQKR